MSSRSTGYFDKLETRCRRIESNLCIGLDPDSRRIPKHVGAGPDGVYRFCSEIVEATSDYAAAFKPNLAFFEALGTEGWHVLRQVLDQIDGDNFDDLEQAWLWRGDNFGPSLDYILRS
ncbi:hypothetical protein IIC65_09515, partial [Candidatus Sumerlaeota bacterium]|nr:hypothetical protein [Candidatus Sumerlaeota bacterium]